MCFTVNFAAEPAGGAYTSVFYDKDFGHIFLFLQRCIFIYVVIVEDNVVKSLCSGTAVTVEGSWAVCCLMITKLALILQNLTYMYITLCDGSNSFWTKSFWTLDRRDFPPKKKKKQKPSIIPQNTLFFFLSGINLRTG